MKVVAIIPTLNEEKGIKEVIRGFKKSKISQIIVADGGSTDKTTQIAKNAGAKVINVPRGKGNGFRAALQKIKLQDKTYYVMIDGDASYNSLEINKLLNEIKEDLDVVTGHRKLLIHNGKSFVHAIGNILISLFGSTIFFHWNPDICTGYWVFKGSALKKLKTKLTAQEFELEAELFTNIAKMGLKHKSVKITYSVRKGESKLRVRDAFKILRKLVINRIHF